MTDYFHSKHLKVLGWGTMLLLEVRVATTAGTLYYFNGTTWAAADASAVNTSTGMLGIGFRRLKRCWFIN